MRYILVNKRSIVTGRALAEALNARVNNNKKFKHKPSVLIRWGNSYAPPREGCIELNSIEAVRLASDKLAMAKILSSAENVPFPKVFFTEDDQFPDELIERCQNGEEFYFRNHAHQVRRRSRPMPGDLYCTEVIEKAREFRVHVFNGKTIGVYEKIPHDASAPYWKSENVDFKRIDLSLKENRKEIKGVRPAAKAATEALGMLFSGVDVIISTSGEIFVNEVNSAPSLNSLNIDRWAEEIENYLQEKEESNG